MAFTYKDNVYGVLKADNTFTSINDILGKYSRPAYIYDLDEVKKRVRILQEGFSNEVSLHYAMKSNHHPEILKTMKQLGAGVDTVSMGEVKFAIEAGIDPSMIVLSGVGKTIKELNYVINLDIKQINVECPAELLRIGKIARENSKTTRVALRYNPDVDPDTHPYIKTGFRDNKFGMDTSFMPEVEKILQEYKAELNLVGLTLHIGSQIRTLDEFQEAVKKTRPVWDHFKNLGFDLKTIDVGGGVGIDYESDNFQEDYDHMQVYAKMMYEITRSFEAEVLIEPGRIISARSGVLVTEVQYIKNSPYKNFAIVDTGMHHLLRPSLYKAYHRVLPVNKVEDDKVIVYDVVGPICESSDVVGYDRPMQELKEGDLLVVCDAGAYGSAMASAYNAHEFPLEITI